MGIRQSFIDRMTKVQNSAELIDASMDVLKFNEYAARLDSFAACVRLVKDDQIRESGMSIITDIADHIALYTENLIVQRELAHSYLERANTLRRELLAKRREAASKKWSRAVSGVFRKSAYYQAEISMLEKITDNEQMARNTERKILGLRAQLEHTYMVRCDILQTMMNDNGVTLKGVFLPKQEAQLAVLDKLVQLNQTLDVGSLRQLFMTKSSDVPTVGFVADKTPSAEPLTAKTTSTAKISTTKTTRRKNEKPKDDAPSTASLMGKKVT